MEIFACLIIFMITTFEELTFKSQPNFNVINLQKFYTNKPNQWKVELQKISYKKGKKYAIVTWVMTDKSPVELQVRC